MHEGKRRGEGDEENRREEMDRNAAGREPETRGRANERKYQRARQHTATMRKGPKQTLGAEIKGIASRKKKQEKNKEDE